MDDSRQIGQTVPAVDPPASGGSYYQPIGTGDSLPPNPVLPTSGPVVSPSPISETSPARVAPAPSLTASARIEAPTTSPVSQTASTALPVQPVGSSAASMSQKMQTANTPKPKKPMLYVGIGLVVIVMSVATSFVVSALLPQKTTRSLDDLPPVDTTSQQTVQQTTEPVLEDRVLQPPVLPQTTSISGKVCPTADGNLFFYNLDELLVYMQPVTADQTSYVKKLPVGNYVVFYQSTDGEERIGYTGTNENNALFTVALADGEVMADIDACNAEMDWKSVPIESYGLGEYEN